MSPPDFSFTLLTTDGRARQGEIVTAHGVVRTPAFMPVGTQAAIKGVHLAAVRAAGADIVLGNTYHLMLRPGAELIARLGGLHSFMNWPHPILTDSGGFQVMSLSELRKLDETGVTFRSHIDGAMVALTPERAVEVQNLLGADIVMQLDECLKLPAPREEIERAMLLSLRWAGRCKRAFEGAAPGRALFGIVQGGDVAHLRERSADALSAMQLKGYAVGGLAVGEPQAVMLDMLDVTCPCLPAERPRYLMGVGTPDDLVKSVARGIDMFDCVLPTRNARNGQLLTRHGPLNIRNARYADDPSPIDEACGCYTCLHFSRAYLRHLVSAGEMLGATLGSMHNLFFYLDLMEGMRKTIEFGSFEEFRQNFHRTFSRQLLTR